MRSLVRHPLVGYLIAVLSVVITLGLAIPLRPFMESPSLALFALPVALSALLGLGPGLLATALSGAAINYFLIEPYYQFGVKADEELIRLLIFMVVAGIISAVQQGRIRAEREQRHTAEQLQAILAGAADGITAQGLDGKLLFANDMAARLSGFPDAKTFLATPIPEVMAAFELMDEDGNPLSLSELPGRMALQGQATERTLRFRIKATGEEQWSLVRAAPIHDDSGKVRFAVNIFQDVTHLKQVENALREERERLSVTLSSIGDAVIATDVKGGITFINPVAQDLTGWSMDEAKGKPLAEVFQIIHEETRAPVENPVDLVLREGKTTGLANPTALIARDGREIPIDDSGAPIRDGDGKVMGVILVFRDIRERKTSQSHIARLSVEAERQRQQLADITASVPGVVWETWGEPNAATQRTDFVSSYVETLLGYSVEEWLSTPNFWLTLVHPDDKELAAQNAARDFAAGGGINTFRWVTKTGRTLWAEGHSVVIYDEAGNPAGMRGVTLDITQRREAEEVLKQNQREMSLIMNGIPALVAYIDSDHRYRYNNHTYAQWFGQPEEAVIGKRVPEVLGQAAYEAVLGYIEMALMGQEADYELLVPYQSGGTRFVHARYIPDKDDKGRVRGFISIVEDISDRHATEAALRERENRFHTLANAAPVLIWLTDETAAVTFFNRQWQDFTGEPSEAHYGQAWQAALHPDDVGRVMPEWTKNFAIRAPITIEFRLRHHTGEYRWLLVTGVPLFRGEEFTGYSLSGVDIHDRKREEDLQRFLNQASEVLASSLDYEDTLARVAQLAVPQLADWCAIDMKTPEGELQRLGVAHIDPAKVQLAHQLREAYPTDMNAPSGVPNVLRTGEPEVLWEIPSALIEAIEDHDLRSLIRELGLRSSMILPLTVEEETIGAITLVTAESGRLFNQYDFNLARELAHRAAMVIDKAWLYDQAVEQRENLRVTLSSIGDAVIATDEKGRITFMNTVAEKCTVWTQAEATGEPLENVFRIVNEETRRKVESPVAKVLREGKIVGLANHTILIAKDGTEIAIDDSGAPIRGEDGEIVGVILVFRDISERKEFELERETARVTLQQSLERTRDLYDVTRQIGLLDTPSDILRALLSSHYLQDPLHANLTIFDPFEPDDVPASGHIIAAWSRHSEASTRVGERYEFETIGMNILLVRDAPMMVIDVATDSRLGEIVRKLYLEVGTGSVILFPLIANGEWYGAMSIHWADPHFASEDDVRHMQGLVDQAASAIYSSRLLDAETAARRRAEEADALKLKFLAMISHELRTPLTSIKGFATTLLAEDIKWSVEEYQEFVGIISHEADNLTDLVEQLLDLSRLQAGSLGIFKRITPLNEIIQTALPQLHIITQKHDLALNIPENLPHVEADPRRIAQVIANLVNNAATYAPEQTRIEVRALSEDSIVQVDVTDQGPGIPESERETIFAPFRQAENRPQQETKGAGLGLAIARGLVEAHGGRIWVAETSEAGTTVSFILPIVDVE